MKAQKQGQTGQFFRSPYQNPHTAPEMSINIGDLFLFEPFHTRHFPPFLGLLHAVANQNDPSLMSPQRRLPADNSEPRGPQGEKTPRGSAEKAYHALIAFRSERKVPDYARDAQLIRSYHDAYHQNDKPSVSALA